MFGGFAPLPLRLGGERVDGLPVADHARLAADVVTLKRTAPFAVLVATAGIGAAMTINEYRGRHGVGISLAPGATYNGDGDHTWTWESQYEDEFGNVYPTSIVGARASALTTDNVWVTLDLVAPNKVRVYTYSVAASALRNYKVLLTVYAGPGNAYHPYNTSADITQYGATLDKQGCESEKIPHAWSFYTMIQSMRGSAYGKARGASFVHAETLALARSEAARYRAGEKLATNSIPGSADERLERWSEILSVPQRHGETRHALRQRCAAKFQAAIGPSERAIDEAVQKLLGPIFVKSWFNKGTDLENPPPITYWPGVNPGPSAYAISQDGPWLSERCHYVVEVQQPPGIPLGDVLRTLNVDLFQLLDRMLPAFATFDFAFGPLSSGFVLDESQLDFNGM